MSEVLFVVVAFAVAAFIALPIYTAQSRKGQLSANNINHRAIELQERKQSIYEAIKDIEFDYEMGKLSEEDFHELRQQYKNEAVEVLKQLDQTQTKKVKSKKIYSRKKSGAARDAARFCWVCGIEIMPEDKFCGNCGNNLKEA